MFRLRLCYTKDAPIRYVSHLDMMKLMERLLRRAELPVMYSQGHCPKMRLSMAWPLSVGMTSESEWADIMMATWVSPDKLLPLLNYCAPHGCRILTAAYVNLKQTSLTEQVTQARWSVVARKIDEEETLSLSRVSWLIKEDETTYTYDFIAPAGPKNNTRIQDVFSKTALIHRHTLFLSSHTDHIAPRDDSLINSH